MLIDINLMNLVPYLDFFVLSLVSPSGYGLDLDNNPVARFELSPPRA